MANPTLISSSSNSFYKHVHRLVAQRRYRYQHGEFVLEGLRFIRDILNATPHYVSHLIVSDLSVIPSLIADCPNALSIPVSCLEAQLFKALSPVRTSQGVMAVLRMPDLDYSQKAPSVSVAFLCDGIQNPGNLGAIVRSAAAFGIDHVFYTSGTVDPYHPDSVRAMAGCVYHVGISVWETAASLSLFKNTDVQPIILDSSKGSDFNEWIRRPFSDCESVLFLLGAEGSGVSFCPSDLLNSPDTLHIPMAPSVESLNVAVTAGILGWGVSEKRRLETVLKG